MKRLGMMVTVCASAACASVPLSRPATIAPIVVPHPASELWDDMIDALAAASVVLDNIETDSYYVSSRAIRLLPNEVHCQQFNAMLGWQDVRANNALGRLTIRLRDEGAGTTRVVIAIVAYHTIDDVRCNVRASAYDRIRRIVVGDRVTSGRDKENGSECRGSLAKIEGVICRAPHWPR